MRPEVEALLAKQYSSPSVAPGQLLVTTLSFLSVYDID